jgi:hypothetical protein
LLLEHFLIQDILIGVDSDDEHDFVKKTIENRGLVPEMARTALHGLRRSRVS